MKTIALSFSFVLLIHASLFYTSHSARSGTMCDKVEESVDKTPMDITVGPAVSHTQKSCLQFFKIEVDSSWGDKFLSFEIKIDDFSRKPHYQPLLVAQLNKIPKINSVGEIVNRNPNFTDTNGYFNRKDYHQIVIDKDSYKNKDELYFGFYNVFSEKSQYKKTSVDYTVTATLSKHYPCPQGCSNNGDCDRFQKRCLCKKPFFDLDCSVKAQHATINNKESTTIQPNKWQYYYFDANETSKDLKITINKGFGSIDYSFLFNHQNEFYLANMYVSNGKYRLNPQEDGAALMVQQEDYKEYQDSVVVLGIYNENGIAIQGSVHFELSANTSLIQKVSVNVVIGLSLLLIVIWGLFSVVRFKYHQEMEVLLRRYQSEREEGQTLTKKDIQKHFPKGPFKDLKTSFSQTLCSVCLEDFEPEAACRQLYCEHIYHGNCIEAWLSQHFNCPNCKKDMTKQAIEDFLRTKGRNKQVQKSLESESKNEKRDIVVSDVDSAGKEIPQQPPQREAAQNQPANHIAAHDLEEFKNDSSPGSTKNGAPNHRNQRVEQQPTGPLSYGETDHNQGRRRTQLRNTTFTEPPGQETIKSPPQGAIKSPPKTLPGQNSQDMDLQAMRLDN